MNFGNRPRDSASLRYLQLWAVKTVKTICHSVFPRATDKTGKADTELEDSLNVAL